MNHSRAYDRFGEILDLRERRHPEERSLQCELSDLEGLLGGEADDFAARRQALVIMAAIRGDLTVFPGCVPDSPDYLEAEIDAAEEQSYVDENEVAKLTADWQRSPAVAS